MIDGCKNINVGKGFRWIDGLMDEARKQKKSQKRDWMDQWMKQGREKGRNG